MTLKERIRFQILSWTYWAVSTGVASTVRFHVVGDDRLRELERTTGVIVALWHGATDLPIYYCRHRGYWTMISTSKDGELQNSLVRRRGYKTIRGSSNNSAVKALLETIRKLKEGAVFALTPDGPKGPVKVVQPGTVAMALKSGCPVVPVGIACSPSKRIRSWDSHLLPYPFSKACMVFADPIYLKSEEGKSEQEMAGIIADAINAADEQAEKLLMKGKA